MVAAASSRGVWRVWRLPALVLALAVGGCASAPPNPRLTDVAPDFRQLAGWVDDNHAEALPALQQSCRWFTGGNGNGGANPRFGSAADWQPVCSAARGLSNADGPAVRRFFETWFRPIPAASTTDDGLFTGYFESELKGSWTRTERFNVPIYRLPPRRNGQALPARSRIARGALAGRGLELMWVDDPVDAFFLEIQGSGRVVMTDGSVVGLHYAGQNGQSYFPIGRWLIDQGYATREEMSLRLIKHWLQANPGQARAVMDLNPSYVFFKVMANPGARGAMNLELTPGRSLAVDPSYVPLGLPLWLDLRQAPVPGGALRRLVVAQDTGGAIKGPVRGDLFWGHGSVAEAGAGEMKARGRYTLLVPRTAADRQQAALLPE